MQHPAGRGESQPLQFYLDQAVRLLGEESQSGAPADAAAGRRSFERREEKSWNRQDGTAFGPAGGSVGLHWLRGGDGEHLAVSSRMSAYGGATFLIPLCDLLWC